MSETGNILMFLLTTAWLLPLAGFVVEMYWLRWSHRLSKGAAVCAVGCIAIGFICSFSALMIWACDTGFAWFEPAHHASAGNHAGDDHSGAAHGDATHDAPKTDGHDVKPHDGKDDGHQHAAVAENHGGDDERLDNPVVVADPFLFHNAKKVRDGV